MNVEFVISNERLARAPTRMGKEWQGQMNLTFDISVTAVKPFYCLDALAKLRNNNDMHGHH